MGRLALDLPTALGDGAAGKSGRVDCRAGNVDRAAETFLRWFGCWAGGGH